MKVSVVIATYNRAQALPKSIKSVLKQTYGNFELLVIDDGSTDGTNEIVEDIIKKDNRVKYIALPENRGATGARNRGVAEATGDLVMVWDSDDELFPNALQQVVSTFQANPALGIVSASCKQLRPDGTERKYKKRLAGEIALPQILCKYLPNNEKVRVVRAEIFKQVKYQARNIDFVVNGYLASLGKWYHLGEELGILHLESDEVSLTAGRKRPNRQRSIQRVGPLLRYLEHFGGDIKQNCPRRYAAISYGVSIGLLLQGRIKEAKIFTAETVKLDSLFLYKKLWLVARLPGGPQMLRLLIK